MIAPDHWVPLTVVSNRLNYSRRRTYSSAAVIGALHAGTSEALAGIALLAGVFLARSYLKYLELASVVLLVAVGIYFIVNGYTEEPGEKEGSLSSISSILAISAFPDFALIPIMLAGSSLPASDIGIMLLSFVLISALSLTLMAYGTVRGFSRAIEKVPPRYIDYVMGLILFATAAVIVFTPF